MSIRHPDHSVQKPSLSLIAADSGLEYDDLARGVKSVVRNCGIAALSARRLAAATETDVRAFVGGDQDVPQAAERARLLREVRRWPHAMQGASAAA